jgi:hypothetical protein
VSVTPAHLDNKMVAIQEKLMGNISLNKALGIHFTELVSMDLFYVNLGDCSVKEIISE